MWLKKIFGAGAKAQPDIEPIDETEQQGPIEQAINGEPGIEVVDTTAIIPRELVPSAAPTYAGKPIPFYPNRGLAVPAADPAALLQTQDALLRKLHQASGFNYEDFDMLLRPVLLNYAAFVHLLPASENHHHWDIGGLLRHGLECCFYAARKCEGAVFALDFTPAQRKALEPRYRLCAILGALMHDLGKPLIDVGAIDESGELQWDPHVETLHAWLKANQMHHYFITWRHGPRGMKHEAFTTAAVYRIVPERTMRWIAEGGSQKPFSEMLLAMTTRHDDTNVLVEIIKHADQASVSRDILASRQRLAETGQGGLRSLAARLVRSVHDKILSGAWRLNRIGDPVWYTEDGIVAVFPEITRQMIEAIRSTGEHGIAYDSMQVLEILADYGFTQPCPLPNGNFKHTWEAKLSGEDRGKAFSQKMQVIRFNAEAIIPAVTVKPVPVKVEWADVEAAKASEQASAAAAIAPDESSPAEPDEQAPIVLATGSLPAKPSLGEAVVTEAVEPEPALPEAQHEQLPAQGDDAPSHQQQYPHLYPQAMQDIELPDVVGGQDSDPVLPAATAAVGQGEIQITADDPASDPNHPYFRDKSTEKDFADEKRDEVRQLMASEWPPATADEANAWLKGKRPLGIYLQDIAEMVRAGRLRRNDGVFVIDERVNLKFPMAFQELGADVYELRTEFSEIGWLERDPATPTSQNVSITHPKTHQPVSCIRLNEDMSHVFRLITGKSLADDKAPESHAPVQTPGTKKASSKASAGAGLGPYLTVDDIGRWTPLDFAGDPNPELGAVLRHGLWRFMCDRHNQDAGNPLEQLLELDERLVKSTISEFLSQHAGLTRSVVHQLCVDKRNALLNITQYANASSGRWELRVSEGYSEKEDAEVAATVRERNFRELGQ